MKKHKNSESIVLSRKVVPHRTRSPRIRSYSAFGSPVVQFARYIGETDAVSLEGVKDKERSTQLRGTTN
jgi:hypothetical protein